MASERMPLGKRGMIEIVARRAGHPYAFHHPPGSHVRYRGERDNLGETDALESEFQDSLSRLSGIALPPVLAG